MSSQGEEAAAAAGGGRTTFAVAKHRAHTLVRENSVASGRQASLSSCSAQTGAASVEQLPPTNESGAVARLSVSSASANSDDKQPQQPSHLSVSSGSAAAGRTTCQKQLQQSSRQGKWLLAPSAFHQSFDTSAGRRQQEQQQLLSASSCETLPRLQQRSDGCLKSSFVSPYRPGRKATSAGVSRQSTRASGGGGVDSRQTSLDEDGPPSDIGGIGIEWMRFNGALPFRNLLASASHHQSSLQSVQRFRNKLSSTQTRAASCGDATSGGGGGGPTGPQVLQLASASPLIASDTDRHPKYTDERLQPKTSTAPAQEPWRRRSSVVSIVVCGEDGDPQPVEKLQETNDGFDEAEVAGSKVVQVKNRLAVRRELYDKRKQATDWALVFALLGIGAMITENELSAAGVYTKGELPSNLMRTFIMLTTAVLLSLIVYFHVLEVKLFMNDNSAEDWQIAVTQNRVIQLGIELFACAICPLPIDAYVRWSNVNLPPVEVVIKASESNGTSLGSASEIWPAAENSTEVPLDVLLSIPMFLRLYLIGRAMLLHSRLFTDAASRSIGALNRINFNSRFVLKTLMTLCPGTVLLVFTVSLLVIASWILRLCERYEQDGGLGADGTPLPSNKHKNYLNSLWMIAITFLSIGYGDIVPNTQCGRAVAVVTGIMGAGTSSLVVAVIARKLELTRAEKHVHTFMMDTQLTKRLKHAAANVLRETWLIYKHRRLAEKMDTSKIRHHQRKFLIAIYELRKVKRDQRKLAENSATIGDVAKTGTCTYELLADMRGWQDGVGTRLCALESQMTMVQEQLTRITELLSRQVHSPPLTDSAAAVAPCGLVRRRPALPQPLQSNNGEN